MNHYDEINSANYIFLTNLFDHETNNLVLEIVIGFPEKEDSEVIMNGVSLFGKKIITTESSSLFRIKFNNYIGYVVLNESYSSIEGNEFIGNRIRVYLDSNFLNYIRDDTFADSNYPGEFKQYSFLLENHTINVVSTTEPIIEKLNCNTKDIILPNVYKKN